MNKGDTMQVGAYTLKVVDLTQGDTPNYQWDTAILEVSKNGKSLGTLEPTRRFYKIAQQATAKSRLRTRLNEDLYINYAAREGDKATLQAYVFPLVTWIWVGAMVLICGTLVRLVPSKVARSYPRTEVVGIAKRMFRLKCSLLFLICGLLVASCRCLAQTESQIESDEVKRVGTHISCQCGACNENVNCIMSAGPVPFLQARPHEDLQNAEGRNDAMARSSQAFITEYGQKIFRHDPNSYFWVVPYVSLGVGAIVI